MPTQVIVKESSSLLSLLRWSITVSIRFFIGRPMSGKKQDNATFLKGATRAKPGKQLTAWQRKPHIHRALIRHSVFWPICGITALAIRSVRDALLVAAFILCLAAYPAFRKVRVIFFAPFTSTDAVTGDRSQHWILRPKYKRLIHRQKVPGVLERKDRVAVDFPPDVERALREVIDAENAGIAPATRVRPVRK